MKEYNLPFEMKPKIFNKGFCGAFFLCLIFWVMIYIDTKDLTQSIISFICISVIFLVVAMYLRRTIVIENDGFIFKWLLRKEYIKYNEIISLDFAVKNAKANQVYFVINKGNQVIVPNVQLYNKDEFRILLDNIKNLNQTVSCHELIVLLDRIKWVK